MPQTQLQCGDAVHAVELRQGPGGQLLATVDGQIVELSGTSEADASGTLRMGHRVISYYAVRDKDSVEVWIDGRIYRLQKLGGKTRAGATADARVAAEILAPMPGSILRINVEQGGSFAAHQPLIIMESMKMEITLSAPHAGRIRELHCRVGELVPMNKVLVKLEPMTADAPLPPKS